jgi:hypothetical protein
VPPRLTFARLDSERTRDRTSTTQPMLEELPTHQATKTIAALVVSCSTQFPAREINKNETV